MNKHIFFNTLYLLIIVSIVLFGSGTLMLMNECKFYKLYYSTNTLRLILIVLPSISGYIISVILKYKKEIKIVYYSIIPLISILIMFSITDDKEKRTLNSKSIVTKGVILENKIINRGYFLTISFLANSKQAKARLQVKRNKLSLGDTVLIFYNAKCTYLNGIYKLYPTKAQLEQCKNDCYLINGKLIPIKKKQRENIK